MIKTTFTYDEQSLIDFFTFHLKRKDKIRWIYYGVTILFFILGVVVLLIFKKYLLGLLIFISSTIMFLSFPSRAKRAAKKTSNSRYKRDPQNIIFYNDKIEQHTERQILVYNWSLVTDVHETKKYIYFYVSKQGALIVNKETITKEDYDKLIDLVKNNNKKYYIYSN